MFRLCYILGPTVMVKNLDHAKTLMKRWRNAPSRGQPCDVCLEEWIPDQQTWDCVCRKHGLFTPEKP